MGVQVSVMVQLPNGQPVPGAQITATNHDAWSAKHKEWKGTSDHEGRYIWSNLDKGTRGDRYTFAAVSSDVNGIKWIGEVSDRIRGPKDLVIVLHRQE
jgi:hypothetical protein